MSKYRDHLPQLNGGKFITDGGLETTLIFHKGKELPFFAAFDLLNEEEGCSLLKAYYSDYCIIAQQQKLGFVLESPTWRASSSWGQKLGYPSEKLEQLNLKAIRMMQSLRETYDKPYAPVVISGCIGPRDDGYSPQNFMSAEEAEAYHREQIETFAGSEADMVTALTMTYPEEAIGIVSAANKAGMPVAISFTLETDGKLPCSISLGEAIQRVDAATDYGASYFMINCAHPTHFARELTSGEKWLQRLRGIRANASCKSHAELDEATKLDDGNPEELGRQYHELLGMVKHLNVIGGCCGTDHRHVEQVGLAYRQ